MSIAHNPDPLLPAHPPAAAAAAAAALESARYRLPPPGTRFRTSSGCSSCTPPTGPPTPRPPTPRPPQPALTPPPLSPGASRAGRPALPEAGPPLPLLQPQLQQPAKVRVRRLRSSRRRRGTMDPCMWPSPLTLSIPSTAVRTRGWRPGPAPICPSTQVGGWVRRRRSARKAGPEEPSGHDACRDCSSSWAVVAAGPRGRGLVKAPQQAAVRGRNRSQDDVCVTRPGAPHLPATPPNPTPPRPHALPTAAPQACTGSGTGPAPAPSSGSGYPGAAGAAACPAARAAWATTRTASMLWPGAGH